MKIPYINIHSHLPNYSADAITIFNNLNSDINKNIPNENPIQDYFSAGIHPWFIDEINFVNQLESLELIIQDKNCLFIGECGLDKLKCSDFSIQQRVFSVQIDHAVKYNKPMILHCVKAFDETISMLKNKITPDKIVFHGFHKSKELALDLTSKGFYLSLGKIFISHPKKAGMILESVNPDKLFFETDDTDISIEEFYKIAAEISGRPLDFWKEQLYRNFNRITVL